jgi:hypothetical protein
MTFEATSSPTPSFTAEQGRLSERFFLILKVFRLTPTNSGLNLD